MHLAPLGSYMTFLDQGDHQAVGDLILESAHKLARIGAELLICPDSAVYMARDYVLQHSPLPWLSVAEVVAERAVMDGYKKVSAGLTLADPEQSLPNQPRCSRHCLHAYQRGSGADG